MKTTLEPEDIQLIASTVIEGLKPYLSGIHSNEESIFDKKGLSEYLKVDVSWIDRNLHALPHFKLGKYIRFKQSHIDRWIENEKKTPSPYLKVLEKGRWPSH